MRRLSRKRIYTALGFAVKCSFHRLEQAILLFLLTSGPAASLTSTPRRISWGTSPASVSLARLSDGGARCWSPRNAWCSWYVQPTPRASWWCGGARKLPACGVDVATAWSSREKVLGVKSKPRALPVSMVWVAISSQSKSDTSSGNEGCGTVENRFVESSNEALSQELEEQSEPEHSDGVSSRDTWFLRYPGSWGVPEHSGSEFGSGSRRGKSLGAEGLKGTHSHSISCTAVSIGIANVWTIFLPRG